MKLESSNKILESNFAWATDKTANFVVTGTKKGDINKGEKHYKWYKNGTEIHGGETLKFIPLKNITYHGERQEKLLDYIQHCELDEKTREDNIESLTYLPDLFFRHGRSEEAWYWIKHIISQKDLPHEHKSQGTNGDYPEIAFTFISQVIEGLMGISANAASGEIVVTPCLPRKLKTSNFLI